jgi:hypothetical protein
MEHIKITVYKDEPTIFFTNNINNEFNCDEQDVVIDYYYYNQKQLITICNFYGIKTKSKTTKNVLINLIIEFETTLRNADMVSKRKKYWYFIERLKNDAFMKKYIFTDFF